MILRLYGYLEVQLLNQVIVQLCYSSNHILNANGITCIGLKKTQQEIVLKPDTLVFNFVLKAWHECLDVQSCIKLVQSSNGTTQRDTEYGNKMGSKQKNT